MRLAYKLTAALTLGVLLVMGAYAFLQIRQEVILFDADLRKNARVGRALRGTVEAVWRHEGEERARQLIEEADDETNEVAIRLVWPLAAPGHPRRPKLQSTDLEALIAGKEIRLVLEDATGDPVRYTYVPLSLTEAPRAALELRESLRAQRTFIRMNRLAIGAATVAIAAVCGLIAMTAISWLVSRPLQLLREQARRLGAGDFSHRLKLRQRDEIGDLALDMNETCERMVEAHRKIASETDAKIAALEQLRHTDRLATIGKLASGIAHEMGTPLNVVSLRAQEIACATGVKEEIAASARIIEEQAGRMSAIIRQLLDFSGRRKPALGPADLGDVINRTIELIGPVAEKAGVTVNADVSLRRAVLHVDQNQIQQALTNLILNGIQSMPGGGQLTVRITRRHVTPPGEAVPGDYWAISIKDDGEGIPADALPHIFEPFYTTKRAGQGTGLGLPVAEGIVAEHGGWIAAEPLSGQGSRFTVFLPAAEGTGHMAEAVQ